MHCSISFRFDIHRSAQVIYVELYFFELFSNTRTISQDAETFLYALRYVNEEAYESVSFAEFIEDQAEALPDAGR